MMKNAMFMRNPKHWLWRILLLIILFTIVYSCYNLADSLPLPQKIGENSLRICAANINYQNKSRDTAAQDLSQIGADILIVLEWQGGNLNMDVLKNAGYRVVLNEARPGSHGVCLLVKSSILNIKTSLVPAPVKGPCPIPAATARFSFRRKNIALLGVHAPPPMPACKGTTIPTIETFCKWIKNGRLIRNTGSGKKGDLVILAGDLNMFVWLPAMGCLEAAGLKDAYKEMRWRYGATWSPLGLTPAIARIDYIWAAHQSVIKNAFAVNISGSDHRAVVADIVWE